MLKYAINMHKYAQNKLYAKNMQIICTNMLKICIKYAKKSMEKVCNYKDFNMRNMQKICKKYV